MHLPTPRDLEERRDALGLTQSELAERAGVSQPLIARIEGDDVDPRLSTLRRIVDALDEAEGGVVRAGDLMSEDIVGVAPDDAVHEALDLMLTEGYSQVPVLEDREPKGMISNGDIRQARERHDESVGDFAVAEVMSETVSTVEHDATLDEINDILDRHRAVIVVEGGRAQGIVTEADVAARVS